MKLNVQPEIFNLIERLKASVPRLRQLKAEAKEKARLERQCTGTTKKGERCRAWSVYGSPENVCIKHGGAKTAAIPKSERYPACTCPAYNFPHRQRSGFCVYPEEPIRRHPTPQGQRRYYKRIRKERIKKWLKSLEA